MKKAVLIGAGSIGRGFIGEVLHKSGYDLTFLDVSEKLVEDMNKQKKYSVIILGADESEYVVDGIRAFTPEQEGALDALKEADIITTAIGPSVLKNTSKIIAQGIKERFNANIKDPLTIIACENMEYGSSKLGEYVNEWLSEEERVYCAEYVAFPDCEVSRMVIPQIKGEPLSVKVEGFMEWVVDENALKADISDIKAIKFTDNPTAYIKRKMYTLTGHAIMGYKGYLKGYEYGYQAMYDDEIFELVYNALTESGKAWSMEYGKSMHEFNKYITIMLRRFSDNRLKDPIIRICREPIRKLSKDERLVGPANTALKHGILPYYIVEGIKCALEFDCAQDPQAVELQKMIKDEGADIALKKVMKLEDNHLLYPMIKA